MISPRRNQQTDKQRVCVCVKDTGGGWGVVVVVQTDDLHNFI